jgi:hypothetical protein
MSHRDDLADQVRNFQTGINTLAAGDVKTQMQAQLNQLIDALVAANACGPLRVGNELPAPS